MSFGKSGESLAADRSARSVFVGNISYEVPEDTIRQIFSKVGQVLSMKMMFDRETGKPKGFGFIEFPDVQTAELAIRNLNGYELNGRPLRVGSSNAGDRNADEIAHLRTELSSQNNVEGSPYGPEPEDGKAPQAISRSVASLSPETMFELMKQMKELMRSNPNEAKQMIVENPQLAYALLQAQVVMRIVDPQVALAMFHRETPRQTQPIHPAAGFVQPAGGPPPQQVAHPGATGPSHTMRGQHLGQPPMGVSAQPVHGNFGHQATHAPSQVMSVDDEQNAKLLVEVMKLSDAEIAMLEPNDRSKIIELRNQLRKIQ